MLSLGGPVELDSSGHCEDDQMRAGPLRSQWRGLKILEEVEIVIGPSVGWSRTWFACCLRSSQRRLR
jgi:hypothetical protein